MGGYASALLASLLYVSPGITSLLTLKHLRELDLSRCSALCVPLLQPTAILPASYHQFSPASNHQFSTGAQCPPPHTHTVIYWVCVRLGDLQ